jgi:hypothetical protein
MRAAVSTAIVSLLALGGCSGATADPGLDALVRASGAQFVRGALESDMSAPGPMVTLISTNSTVVAAGFSRNLTGSASGKATAVLIGLEGDVGYWIVPTGVMDTDSPGNYTFQTTLAFSASLPTGPAKLIFRAVDASGQIGASRELQVKVTEPLPMGSLVVSLDWDTEADLDLHVTVPNAIDPNSPVVVWAKQPLALPSVDAMGNPLPHPMMQVMNAGSLDLDSNANCAIDGRRQENLIFPVSTATAPVPAPPSGTYEVRVDAWSMCGQPVARWHAIAVKDNDVDNPLGEAVGQLTDLDASRPHVATSGILAFTFTMP